MFFKYLLKRGKKLFVLSSRKRKEKFFLVSSRKGKENVFFFSIFSKEVRKGFFFSIFSKGERKVFFLVSSIRLLYSIYLFPSIYHIAGEKNS